MFAIEKSIPVPSSRKGKSSTKYPFRAMSPGDSFAVPTGGESTARVQRRLSVSARNATKRLGAKFVTRVTGQAVRCWRVA